MRPKDRFLAALQRQPVDRVPLFDFLFQQPLFQQLIGRSPDAYNARDAMELTVAMRFDGVWIPYGCFSGWSPEKITDIVHKDEWGTTFQKDAASWPIDAPIAFPLKTSNDLHRYLKAIDRMAKAGVDAMILSDDYGASAQGLLKPQQFKAIYKPGLKKIVDCIKANNLPVFLHSYGRIYDYLDDLVEIGIEAYHPVQRTAGMDLARVKKQYGDRICLVGNIDSSRTLPFGTAEQIEAETLEVLRIAAPGYGYILASDHSLHDGIPVKNIVLMFDIARKHGVYLNRNLAA